MGVIKLLTNEKGRFLGYHHELLAKQVVAEIVRNLERLDRRLMLEELNESTTDMSAMRGEQLGEEMVARLEKWCGHYLRAGSMVLVLAKSASGRIVLSRASQSLVEPLRSKLHLLSEQLGNRILSWRLMDPIFRPPDAKKKRALSVCGMAVPCALALPGESLSGHFFLIHRTEQSFIGNDIDTFREAVREYAILLNGERLRQQWLNEIAVFRHEFLGPVQGLASAAKTTLHLAEQGGVASVVLDRAKAKIATETANIRRWRENQRLYFEERVDIRPRSCELKPIVERCIERYQDVARERRISLLMDWQIGGGAVLRIDDHAFDVALSNLIDNACKYSFANQEIQVCVRVVGSEIEILVNDVGHPVPEGFQIYQPGQRLDWKDRVRTLEGQGLGLAMARAVFEGHGGTLRHKCEPLSQGREETQSRREIPFRVEFIVKVPHYWRKARQS